jgi:membrane fusion protein, multidrug efflux system
MPAARAGGSRAAFQSVHNVNKAIVATLVVAGLAIAAGGGYWYGQHGQRVAPPSGAATSSAPANASGKSGAPGAPLSVVVEAVKVTMSPMAQAITAVGSLRSDESVTLRPEVAGRINAIAFQEGQRVAKGAVLVRLDPAVPEAEAQQARANVTLAKAKFDRAIDLAQRHFISGQAKDEAENNLKVAEAALRLAEAKLAKTTLTAPFSGIIGLRVVSVGDYVKEGADVVNIEAIDPLKVDFRVPETYLRQVQVGQSLTVTLDAVPGKSYEGKVFAVNPLVDAAGRAIVIRAIVRNSDSALRPGMFARVRLFTHEAKDAMVIPDVALVPSGDEKYVYRIVDDSARRTKVEIGQRREGMVEILQGLDRNDTVVTAGQLKIRDGSPVQIAKGPGANGEGAGAAAKNGAVGTTATSDAPADKASASGAAPGS